MKNIMQTLESNTTKGFFIAALVLIVVFSFSVLANAAEYVAPAQTVTIGTVQTSNSTMAIVLSNNETPLNAMEVELYFNPTHIYVSDVAIGAELCEERFLITKEIDNVTGRIFYQCGTIIPFTGTSTTLAEISILPLTIGATDINFGTSTNALAHDGHGTNVTKERLGSVFNAQG